MEGIERLNRIGSVQRFDHLLSIKQVFDSVFHGWDERITWKEIRQTGKN